MLLPTLLEHGCLLTNFLANMKILGGCDALPTPPNRPIPGSYDSDFVVIDIYAADDDKDSEYIVDGTGF